MVQNNTPIRPYLKWAGGKRQLLPEIKKYIPADMHTRTYYEPFVGAGAVFFALQPGRAVINDANTQLILTYKAIRDNVDELIVLLEEHKSKNSNDYYYKIRNMDRDASLFERLTVFEKAARLLYLNKTCYNGLYRVNARGLFNVPFGTYKNPVIYRETVLRRISKYLNTNEITILNADFEDSLAGADERAFIYFDPPYHSPGNTGFTGYQSNGFGEKEQERLRNVFIAMTERGAKCLLSNADTEFIRDLYNYPGLELISLEAKRPINANSAGRGAVREILIRNPEKPARQFRI
jgi:DNA adenine methylase